MFLTAKVAVDKAAYHFDLAFDYLIPREMQGQLQPGCRVLVPFGGGNRTRQGIVLALSEAPQEGRLKPVAALLDESPILNAEMMGLMKYLRGHTFCTWYDAVHVLLPLGVAVQINWRYTARALKEGESVSGEEARIYQLLSSRKKGLRGTGLCRLLGIQEDSPALKRLLTQGLVSREEEAKRRVMDETVTMIRLTERFLTNEELPMGKLTPKQRAVVEQLLEVRNVSVKEICYLCAVTKAVLRALEKKGILEFYQQPVYRRIGSVSSDAAEKTSFPVTLTPGQRQAEETLWDKYREGKACVALLHGVTGSGKTQVYLSLIRRVLDQGRNVIVLVPEISLTPQAVSMFRDQFGSLVAVLHSGLSSGERMDEWKRLRDGKARIAVGTRSAVFAPLENIGLIVMDEEQESTYKSDGAPRFHARDVAKYRCMVHNAMLLLASATPSVESYFHAVQGRYLLVTLDSRYSGGALPPVRLIDMNDQPFRAQEGGVSEQLAQEISENLEAGKQTILLLNRRGYSTIVKCSACGAVASCPNCSISLTYHASNRQLICHYCGYTRDAIESCPQCGSKYVRYNGLGTQKAEQKLQELFPRARILRMDADTTMTKFSHEKYLAAFGAKKYDIMIGTQMVAKGLDFPDVTLVGVLSADMYLYSEDYRSAERTFDLLTQVVGRSGRGASGGRACIQTFSPDNDIIGLSARQDYLGFYKDEIAARRMMLYPPFCDLCAIGFSGADQQKTRAAAGYFWELLRQAATARHPSMPIRVLGPVESTVLKVNNKYRYKIIIKCRANKEFRQMLSELLREFGSSRAASGIGYYADMGFDGMV